MSRIYRVPDYIAPDACPHCGGDGGFYQKWSCTITTVWSWDGVCEDSSEPSAKYTGKFRCFDCNKIVEKYIEYTSPTGVEA